MNTNRQSRLRIGILSFAHGHANSYAFELEQRDDVVIAGIWDADPERGAEMARRFDTIYYRSKDILLGDELDGVIIASENVHHRSLVEAAASAGVKAILCEKPLATTVPDAESMIRYCSDRGVKLATSFPCRYAPSFRSMREKVLAGEIGEILAIRGTNRGSMPGGWFVDTSLSGGGAIMDHTVHVADLMWLLLGQEAVSVYAESGNQFHHQSWDDTGLLTLTYADGVFATIDTSWCRPKGFPTSGDVTLQIIGTRGVLDLDLFGQKLVHYNDASQSDCFYWGSSLDKDMIDDFLLLCEGGSAPYLATGEDGLRAGAITSAAYAAVLLNDPVNVDAGVEQRVPAYSL